MMEPKFIELHTRYQNSLDGGPVSVNVAAIQCFHPDPDHQMPDKPGVVEATDGSFYTVTESYDEIKQLIHDSGILIHRADPRLDETHRLTMEDLQDMIGEPVWNSNLLRWELVKRADDLYITTCSLGEYNSSYGDKDLIRTPLYRMKREK